MHSQQRATGGKSMRSAPAKTGLTVQELKAMTAQRLAQSQTQEASGYAYSISKPPPTHHHQRQQQYPQSGGYNPPAQDAAINNIPGLSVQDIKELTRQRLAVEGIAGKPATASVMPSGSSGSVFKPVGQSPEPSPEVLSYGMEKLTLNNSGSTGSTSPDNSIGTLDDGMALDFYAYRLGTGGLNISSYGNAEAVADSSISMSHRNDLRHNQHLYSILDTGSTSIAPPSPHPPHSNITHPASGGGAYQYPYSDRPIVSPSEFSQTSVTSTGSVGASSAGAAVGASYPLSEMDSTRRSMIRPQVSANGANGVSAGSTQGAAFHRTQQAASYMPAAVGAAAVARGGSVSPTLNAGSDPYIYHAPIPMSVQRMRGMTSGPTDSYTHTHMARGTGAGGASSGSTSAPVYPTNQSPELYIHNTSSLGNIRDFIPRPATTAAGEYGPSTYTVDGRNNGGGAYFSHNMGDKVADGVGMNRVSASGFSSKPLYNQQQQQQQLQQRSSQYSLSHLDSQSQYAYPDRRSVLSSQHHHQGLPLQGAQRSVSAPLELGGLAPGFSAYNSMGDPSNFIHSSAAVDYPDREFGAGYSRKIGADCSRDSAFFGLEMTGGGSRGASPFSTSLTSRSCDSQYEGGSGVRGVSDFEGKQLQRVTNDDIDCPAYSSVEPSTIPPPPLPSSTVSPRSLRAVGKLGLLCPDPVRERTLSDSGNLPFEMVESVLDSNSPRVSSTLLAAARDGRIKRINSNESVPGSPGSGSGYASSGLVSSRLFPVPSALLRSDPGSSDAHFGASTLPVAPNLPLSGRPQPKVGTTNTASGLSIAPSTTPPSSLLSGGRAF